MLIGDEGPRSNLRVMYGMLANSALARFDAARRQAEGDVRDVYFVNLIRLLEMYRYSSFYSPPPNGVLEAKPMGAAPLSHVHAEPESKLVLKAIEVAHASVSPLPREQFVKEMEKVFYALHSRDVHALTAENITVAKNFLKHFVAELHKGIDNA